MPYFLLVLSTIFWSGNFVLSRGMHASIPPFSLSFWRWAIALLIILPFALPHIRSNSKILYSNFKFLLIQAILGVAGFNTLIYLAMQSTTAINAVLVNSSIPVLIAVVSWVMYREKLTIIQFIGVMISLSGVIFLMVKGNLAVLSNFNFNKGDILVLIAAFTWSVYSANLRKYPTNLHPLAYLFSINFLGLIFILPLYLYEIFTGQFFSLNMQTITTFGYVAIFASVLAFIFWNRAVREVGANKAGPFVHLMPVFSTIMAVFFLGEHLMVFHVNGMLLVFTGIFLTTFKFSSLKKIM